MTRFFLIRNNVPKLLTEKHKQCFYSIAATNEFYNALLRDLFINFSNEFISRLDLNELTENKSVLQGDLVELLTVIKAIAKAYGINESDLDAAYFDKLRVEGDYSQRYIGFFDTTEEPVEKTYAARDSISDPLTEVPQDQVDANLNSVNNVTTDLTEEIPNTTTKNLKASKKK